MEQVLKDFFDFQIYEINMIFIAEIIVSIKSVFTWFK